MAITNISTDARTIIYKMMDVLKEDHTITEKEVGDLERLKDKRKKLAKDMGEIEQAHKLHNIDDKVYNAALEKFEYDTNEIELEELARKTKINKNKFYLKRLGILKRIMTLKSENEYINYKGTKITLTDLYVEFLENIATENIEQLHYKQDFIRLQIAYNQKSKKRIDNRHRFYASEELVNSLREDLFDVKDRIETIDKTKVDPETIDFSKLTAADFIGLDSEVIYKKIFENEDIKKQK